MYCRSTFSPGLETEGAGLRGMLDLANTKLAGDTLVTTKHNPLDHIKLPLGESQDSVNNLLGVKGHSQVTLCKRTKVPYVVHPIQGRAQSERSQVS